MNRVHQVVLIGSTLLGSWLGMQAIHECGHVLGAWVTGGRMAQVVLNPLTFSRTDVADNPHPLVVAWCGPLLGVAAPLLVWGLAASMRASWAFVPRFFAGFCLLANGLYLAMGSFDRVGDCGDMLRYGAERWHLWLFGTVTVPVGLWLWHRQGPAFGLGPAHGRVSRSTAYGCLVVCMVLLAMGIAVGGN